MLTMKRHDILNSPFNQKFHSHTHPSLTRPKYSSSILGKKHDDSLGYLSGSSQYRALSARGGGQSVSEYSFGIREDFRGESQGRVGRGAWSRDT
jgi:hypothetical protein